MATPMDRDPASTRLRCGIVLSVHEETCEIAAQGCRSVVRFATFFPSPRTERVSPGHLVALAPVADGTEVVVWRWFDAIVVGVDADVVRLWEPSHGEVEARSRRPDQPYRLGVRAYLSAGLPGADWWVEGATVVAAEHADVELDEVERFCTDHELWGQLV